MRKKIMGLTLIFILGIALFMSNAYAVSDCSSRSVQDCTTENGGKDADGNACKYTGGSCVVNKYNCSTKKHCSCYNANMCPASPRTDDYGNACHALPNDDKCETMSEYNARETSYDKDDDGPSWLENDDVVSCGKFENIPKYIPFTTSLAITILTIISMGMLVIMGTIDLFKGTVSGSDDQIKKNQKAFIGRLTSAIMIFLLVALTKLLVGFIGNVAGNTNGIADCIDLFINNR